MAENLLQKFVSHRKAGGLGYAARRGAKYIGWRLRGLVPPYGRARPLKLEFACFGTIDTCMLRCRMCRKWQEDLNIREPNACGLDDWKAAADSLREAWTGPLQINFGGGEPLSNPWLLDLISYCKKKGFVTNIASNGWLVDREMAKRICASGLDSIILSLDATEEAVHDRLRGVPGVYRKVMDALDLLEKEDGGLYKGICSVLYGDTLDQAQRLAEWARDRDDIDSIYFMAAMQPNNTGDRPYWYREPEFAGLWPKDPRQACAVIDALIAMMGKKGNKIINRRSQLEAFKAYYRDPERFVKRSRCNMDTALHISSCGDIFHCYNLRPLGNIRRDSIAAVLGSPEAAGAREEIHGCRRNCHFLINCFFKEDPQ